MKNIIVLLIICLIGWKGYEHFQQLRQANAGAPAKEWLPAPDQNARPTPTSFTCDGRTHCSQMTSCAEATYFLKNCPNTKMDGNNDGVPCEQQWCR